jgi:SNF2 family DNA or RNA helicase
LKEDVEKSIAPKEETIIEVELTRIQKKYYKAIYEKNFEHLAAGRSRTFTFLHPLLLLLPFLSNQKIFPFSNSIFFGSMHVNYFELGLGLL